MCSVFQFYFPKRTVAECCEISLKLTQIAVKYCCRSNNRTREISLKNGFKRNFAYYLRILSPELLSESESESESEVSSSFSRVLKYESAKLSKRSRSSDSKFKKCNSSVSSSFHDVSLIVLVD